MLHRGTGADAGVDATDADAASLDALADRLTDLACSYLRLRPSDPRADVSPSEKQ